MAHSPIPQLRRRLILRCVLALTPALAAGQAPRIFYTDLVTGPSAGGQNNNGAFVTLYGKRFGSTQGSGSVTVGGGAVAGYPVWTDTKVTIQLGAAAATGNIVLTNASGTSNGIAFSVTSGNIYFVAINGSDGANGSYSTPWSTLTHARDSLAPGDVVYALNGVAQITDDGQGWSSCLTLGANSGSAGKPKAMVVYPGGLATIGNVNSTHNGGCDSGIRAKGQGESYWIFAGFTIRGGAVAMNPNNETGWRIVANDMSCPNGNDQAGCLDLATEVSIAIYGNNIHHVGTNLKPGNVTALYHGVYISEFNHGVDFGWNTIAYVQGCRGLQQHVNTGSSSYDLHIHDNIIHDTQCDGIVMTTVDPSKGTVELYNNLIYNAGTGPANAENTGAWNCMAIEGYDPNGYGPGSGVVEVYNNTMYDCGNWTHPPYGESEGMLLWSNEGNPKKSLRLRNNILYGSTASPYCDDSICSGVTGSNNIFYGNGAPPANPNIQASLNVDPRLTRLSMSNPDFHLQNASPAINAGATIAGLATDFDGVARPQGAAFEIGAYEYLPGGPTMTLAASPTNLAFGNGATLTATITNTGTASVAIGAASITGAGFSIVSQPSYPNILTPNGNAQYTLKFAPAGTGAASGLLTITSSATNSPTTISLSGTGLATTMTLLASPASLAFVDQGTLTTVIANTGNQSVTIGAASITGAGFSIVSQPSYPNILAPNGNAQYTIGFGPAGTGAASGSLTVLSDATNSPTTVSLSGTSVATSLSASPTNLAFGKSSTLTATIANTGSASVTIRAASISGTGFSIATQPSYPYTLTPNATAQYSVKFAPTTTGMATGSLTIVSDAVNSPTSISLTGTAAVSGPIALGKKGGNGTGSSGTSNPINVTWTGGGSTAGSDAILVAVYGGNGPYAASNITDSAGNVYHLDASIVHPHAGSVYVFSCLNAAPASSVTVTPPSFGNFQVVALEYSGLLTRGALDRVGPVHDDGFEGSPGTYRWTTSPSETLAQAPELVLAINAEVYGTVTGYSASGYRQEILQATATGALAVLDAVVSSTNSVSPSGTYTANGGWVASFVLTYKGSSAYRTAPDRPGSPRLF